jgi:hypothetical protein
MSWQVELSNEGNEAQLVVSRLDPVSAEPASGSEITIKLDGHDDVFIQWAEVYGTEGQEIGAIYYRPLYEHDPGFAVDTAVCFVQLLPAMRHISTVFQFNDTVSSVSLGPGDAYTWRYALPLSSEKLQVVTYAGCLYAVTEEVRRARDSKIELTVGRSLTPISHAAQPPPPPAWLTTASVKLIVHLGLDHTPLTVVDTPAEIKAVLLADASRDFPPSTLSMSASFYGKRAHGLLFRDLSPARSSDRSSKEHRVRAYLRAPQPSSEAGRVPSSFQWSSEARAWFGIPRLRVMATDGVTFIGTIERHCMEERPVGTTPDRDLWMFSVDTSQASPAWIETQLVESCVLLPLTGGIKDGYIYRSFDNGHLESLTRDGKTVGARARLQPAVFLHSTGQLLKRIDRETVASDQKHGHWLISELESLDPDRPEVTYSLEIR